MTIAQGAGERRFVAQILPRDGSDTEVTLVLSCFHEKIARRDDFTVGEWVRCAWCIG